MRILRKPNWKSKQERRDYMKYFKHTSNVCKMLFFPQLVTCLSTTWKSVMGGVVVVWKAKSKNSLLSEEKSLTLFLSRQNIPISVSFEPTLSNWLFNRLLSKFYINQWTATLKKISSSKLKDLEKQWNMKTKVAISYYFMKKALIVTVDILLRFFARTARICSTKSQSTSSQLFELISHFLVFQRIWWILSDIYVLMTESFVLVCNNFVNGVWWANISFLFWYNIGNGTISSIGTWVCSSVHTLLSRKKDIVKTLRHKTKQYNTQK